MSYLLNYTYHTLGQVSIGTMITPKDIDTDCKLRRCYLMPPECWNVESGGVVRGGVSDFRVCCLMPPLEYRVWGRGRYGG